MGRRKNLPVRVPNPVRAWLNLDKSHTLTALSDLTELHGHRIPIRVLSRYATGRDIPAARNAQLIDDATCGLASSQDWYEYPSKESPSEGTEAEG